MPSVWTGVSTVSNVMELICASKWHTLRNPTWSWKHSVLCFQGRWEGLTTDGRMKVRMKEYWWEWLCSGRSNYGPNPRKPCTCCLYDTSHMIYQGDLSLTVTQGAVKDMFPNKKTWHPKTLGVSSCMLLFVCLDLNVYSLGCLVFLALFRLKYN